MDEPPGPDEIYCPSCGDVIRRDSRFCRHCGDENLVATDGHSSRHRHSEQRRSSPQRDDPSSSDRAGRETDGWGETRNDSYHWDDRTDPAGQDGYENRTDPAGQDEYGQDSAARSADTSAQRRPGRTPPGEERRPRRTPPGESPPGAATDEDSVRWKAQIGRPTRDEFPLWTIGVATGLGILGVVILGFISYILIQLSGGLENASPTITAAGTAIGQYVGFVGVSIAYLRSRGFDYARIKSYIGVRVPTLKELGIVVLGYVAILVLIIIVGNLVQVFAPTEPAQNQSTDGLGGQADPMLALAVIAGMFLVVGPCEETLYRGVIQNRLRERFSVVPGIFTASAIFAAVHLIALAPGAPLTAKLITIGILFCPAIVLGTVYEYTGNVVVSWLLHSLHNSIIVLILIFGPDTSEAAQSIVAILSVGLL